MLDSKSIVVVLVLGLSTATISLASIENEPIRVTPRNSGPRYDIDEVERTRLTPDSNENQVIPIRAYDHRRQPSSSQQQPNNDASEQSSSDQQPDHIGHISIRRIFLVPMSSQPVTGSLWTNHGSSSDNEEPATARDRISPFGSGSNKPFWPFLPPPRHHLFGADSASRSPTPEASFNQPRRQERPLEGAGGEREDSGESMPDNNNNRQLFDPMQLMVDMLQQALSSAMQPSLFSDLNKDGSSPAGADVPATRRLPAPPGREREQETGDSENKRKPIGGNPGSDLEPLTPISVKPIGNETKEEVIEIDGKKYLKKTEISRKYIGDNIFFTTKRLTLMPLNETDTTETTTTTSRPEVAGANAAPSFNIDTSTATAAPATEATTSTTSTTTNRPTSESPSEPPTTAGSVTPLSSSELPITSTSTGSPAEPTTTTTTTTTESANNPQVKPERLTEDKEEPKASVSTTLKP